MSPNAATRSTEDTNFYFITPVWGEAYVRLFLDISVPSQLSANNLGAFYGQGRHRYVICTKSADVATIRNAPTFRRLSELIEPEIVVVDEHHDAVHDLMSECYRRGIALANAADSAVVLLTPDIVFADGAFSAIRRIAAKGNDTIFIPGLRTLKQGVTLALQSWMGADGIITISPQDLMRVALDNLHPLVETAWWDEGECDLMPSTIYWRVADEGIVARCFHLHPIMVRPQVRGASFFSTVDDDYVSTACPDASRDYIVEDSDELLCIELSDPGRFFITGANKGSVKDAARWAERATTARHRRLFQATVRMHTKISNPALWEAAAQRADLVAKDITARMDRPTWRLIATVDKALAPRIVRHIQDRRLDQALNRVNPAHPVAGGPNAWFWSAAAWILRTYRQIVPWARGVDDWLNLAVFGPPAKPTLWASGFTYKRTIAADLRLLLQNAKSCLVVCRGIETSATAAVLGDIGAEAHFATLSYQGAGPRIVDRDSGAEISNSACDLLIVDHALPALDKLAGMAIEFDRVIARDGRIALLIDAVPSPDGSGTNETAMPADAAAALLTPAFSIESRTTYGLIGSLLTTLFSKWLTLQQIRVRLPRSITFALIFIFLPLRMIGGLITNIVAYGLDRFDATRRFYVSSLIVGKKGS